MWSVCNRLLGRAQRGPIAQLCRIAFPLDDVWQIRLPCRMARRSCHSLCTSPLGPTNEKPAPHVPPQVQREWLIRRVPHELDTQDALLVSDPVG
jgi:hypothetical protein